MEIPRVHPIRQAALHGDLAAVIRLVEEDPSLVHIPQPWGSLPLAIAAQEGHLDVVAYLRSQGAEVDAQHPDSGQSALWYACMGGHPEVVHFLLENGADPNLASTSGVTPLMAASRLNHAAVVPCLLTSIQTTHVAEIDSVDADGCTALAWAAYFGAGGVMTLLLAAGADPTIPDHQGLTPLEKARRQGHHGCVALLEVSG